MKAVIYNCNKKFTIEKLITGIINKLFFISDYLTITMI